MRRFAAGAGHWTALPLDHPGDPDRAIALHEYGTALRVRAQSTALQADAALAEARDALREAAQTRIHE